MHSVLGRKGHAVNDLVLQAIGRDMTCTDMGADAVMNGLPAGLGQVQKHDGTGKRIILGHVAEIQAQATGASLFDL